MKRKIVVAGTVVSFLVTVPGWYLFIASLQDGFGIIPYSAILLALHMSALLCAVSVSSIAGVVKNGP